MKNKQWLSISITALLATTGLVRADYRPFAFSYDTYPMAKGSFEIEQWVTYKGHLRDDQDFKRFEFREEVEYGLADNIRLGLYLPQWSYERSAERRSTQFDSLSAELIMDLANPNTDLIGAAIYFEVGAGRDEQSYEGKLLLHKDWGAWSAVYNFVVETEIEGLRDTAAENEVTGVVGHTVGLSHSITPNLRLGAEAIVESEYADWSEYAGTSVYAGPSISYQGGEVFGTKHTWWFTLTPTTQLTHLNEPDYLVRLLTGVSF